MEPIILQALFGVDLKELVRTNDGSYISYEITYTFPSPDTRGLAVGI
jgi:hypothetical protein